jgi:hypothetical protein
MDMISMGITKRGMTDLDMIIKVTTMRGTTKKGTTNLVKIKSK